MAIGLCLFVVTLITAVALWQVLRGVQHREQMMANLPEPPPGYRWEPIPELSDEFSGAKLNTAQWLDHHPNWLGRTPSEFDPHNVTVGDGQLHLTSTSDIGDISEVADPLQDVWVRSACLSSIEPIASFGYYEARMKASALSMTSSFWMQGEYSEIDIVEQLGAPMDIPSRSELMLMNTHYYPNGWDRDRKTPVAWHMPSGSAEEAHIYGVWWKDQTTIWFYHNGKRVAEIETGGPFDEPMYLFFDTEVFVWEGLPDVASLKDATRNTMTVDWVRSWRLVATTD
jgi:hypothetical protein